jgi:hypothetical protein
MFDFQLIIFLIAILMVGGAVYIGIAVTNKRGPSLDKDLYQTAFLKIESTLDRANRLSWGAVITDSDKLLDRALIDLGVRGHNLGERLRAGKTHFSQINAVWHAHKLRNALAHEHDFEVDYRQARHALDIYKQALQDLGAI